MTETSLIRITQLPAIEEKLLALKESWEQKAHDAQSMVCTEETVQAVKTLRADMRKEFDLAETQRKAVKEQYMAAWLQLEAIYKDCVKGPFTRADAAYKLKISEVEDAQKAQCEKVCRDYFNELCAVHGVDFLRYEQAGIKITMAEAKKKTPSGLFDKLSEFVARVACDIDSIGAMDFRDEIMAEYKRNGYSLGNAYRTVEIRHEEQERERKAAAERAERAKREAEAVAKVEAAAAQVIGPLVAVEPPKEEKLLTVAFKATGTREQLIRVREFMKAEGIKYE